MRKTEKTKLTVEELGLLSFYLDVVEIQRYHRTMMGVVKEKIQNQYEDECSKAMKKCLEKYSKPY